MKKLLLASTVLVMSAGVASAQGVSLSGDARMGLIYNGDDVQLTSRARVTFTLSGETDTGLAFGASFRADQASTGAAGNTRMTAGTVFISGDFGRLTFGDVASAARAAAGDLYFTSLTGLGDLNEVAYLDRAGAAGFATGQNYDTGALYQYSFDGFTGYIGLSQNNVNRTVATNIRRDNVVSVGAKYSFDGLTAAVGYEYGRARSGTAGTINDPVQLLRTPPVIAPIAGTSYTASHLVGSLEYAIDGFKGKVFAGRVGSDVGTSLSGPNTSRTQYGASVEGSFDGTTVTAFAHRTFFKENNYGVGASYDLGGGASIRGGIVRQGSSVFLGTSSNTRADFGLAFTF